MTYRTCYRPNAQLSLKARYSA